MKLTLFYIRRSFVAEGRADGAGSLGVFRHRLLFDVRTRQSPPRIKLHHQLRRETDEAMRQAPSVKDDNVYYLYPHHMLANPLLFKPFNARYHYVVDSACLGLKDGGLTRDVRKTTDIPIDVTL